MTRAVALVLDAIVIDVIAVLAGGAVNLIASLFGNHAHINLIQALFGAAAWVVWSGLYFVTFWTLTGQTPAARLLGFRVTSSEGGRIGFFKAMRRYVWLILSTLGLGLGFLLVLVDDRRRGMHDRLAGTVVRWDVRRRESEPARYAQPTAFDPSATAHAADAAPSEPRTTRSDFGFSPSPAAAASRTCD